MWHGIRSNGEAVSASGSYLKEVELEHAGMDDGCFRLIQHSLIRESVYQLTPLPTDRYTDRFCAPHLQTSGEEWEIVDRPSVEVGPGAVWVERAPPEGRRKWPPSIQS